MTIVIYFHLMRYRDFKHYCLFHVCEHMQDDFPGLVSYNRFVELMQKTILPLAVYLKTRYMGKCSGNSRIYTFSANVCLWIWQLIFYLYTIIRQFRLPHTIVNGYVFSSI